MAKPPRRVGILRKNTEPAVAQVAAADYEAHFHEAPSGYLILSEDGTIIDVNRTLARWTGRRREKLLGSNIMELMSAADRVLYSSHVVPQLAVAERFSEVSADFPAKGGESLPVLLSGVRSRRTADGAVTDRITVVKASARRQYEQELLAALRKAEAAEATRAVVEAELREKCRVLEEKDRLLQENLAAVTAERALLDTVINAADVGLLVVDIQGKTVLANEPLMSTWRSIMGETPMDGEGGGIFSADRVTPLPDEESPVLWAAEGKSFSDRMLWFGSGDQQTAVSVSARPIKANGALSGSVIAFHDVTRLAHALSAQQEFVANISHEFRTPLTSIMGYLDLVLEDGGLPPHLAGALNVAVRNSERLLVLGTDLLEAAPDNKKPRSRPVNLAEAVRTGIASIGSKAQARQVDFLTDLPVSMVGGVDREKFAQAVGHLLSNAVKYSPPGGTVYVQLWQQAQVVCLRIAETGGPVQEADQQKTGTKVFRAGRPPAAPDVDPELMSAKSILQDFGGGLAFVSSAGEGSVYTVTLPVTAEIAALNR